MRKIEETSRWEEDIMEVEQTDKILGGPGGSANISVEQLANRTRKLKDDNASLANRTSKLETDNKSLSDRAKKLEEENVSLTNRVKKLESDNASLTSRASNLEKENTSLTDRTSKLESDNKSLASRASKLESDNKSLASRASKLESDNASLANRTSNLEKENTSLTNNYNALIASRPKIKVGTVTIAKNPSVTITAGTNEGESVLNITFPKALDPEDLPNQLKRNKAYAVGDIAYYTQLPSWGYLYCTVAGTTGNNVPAMPKKEKDKIADGTVTWELHSLVHSYYE